MNQSTTPTVELVRRTEKHTVEVWLEVTGYPVIKDRAAIQTTSRQLFPEAVVITYERSTSLEWCWGITVRVYGRQPGKLLNGWADYRQRQGSEWCPEWLIALVNRYSPSSERLCDER